MYGCVRSVFMSMSLSKSISMSESLSKSKSMSMCFFVSVCLCDYMSLFLCCVNAANSKGFLEPFGLGALNSTYCISGREAVTQKQTQAPVVNVACL